MTDWAEGEPRDPRIDDRVLAVLSESSGRIAFNGLRRTLQVHPESLSRALRRLERDGAITRSERGYALKTPALRDSTPRAPVDVRTVATVALPIGRTADEVFGRLSGRWFGQLRWVGVFDHPGDPWLVWTVEATPSHVMLHSARGHLEVLTDAASASSRPAIDDAAYELLGHAVARVRELPSLPPVATLRPLDGSVGFPAGPN